MPAPDQTYALRQSTIEVAAVVGKLPKVKSKPTSSVGVTEEQLVEIANALYDFQSKHVSMLSGPLRINLNMSSHFSIAHAILPQWRTQLLSHARNIDEGSDTLLSSASMLEYSYLSKLKNLNNCLNEILSFRHHVRRLELDVESFVVNVSEVGLDLDLVPLTQQMNQLHHTYDRAFDLIMMKINSWHQTHLAVASLIVALVAVVISVAAALSN